MIVTPIQSRAQVQSQSRSRVPVTTARTRTISASRGALCALPPKLPPKGTTKDKDRERAFLQACETPRTPAPDSHAPDNLGLPLLSPLILRSTKAETGTAAAAAAAAAEVEAEAETDTADTRDAYTKPQLYLRAHAHANAADKMPPALHPKQRAPKIDSDSSSTFDLQLHEPYGLYSAPLTAMTRQEMAAAYKSDASFAKAEALRRMIDPVMHFLHASDPNWMDTSRCRFLVFLCDASVWQHGSMDTRASSPVSTPPPAASASASASSSWPFSPPLLPSHSSASKFGADNPMLYDFLGYADTVADARRAGRTVLLTAQKTLDSLAESDKHDTAAEDIVNTLSNASILVTTYVRGSIPVRLHSFCMVRRIVDAGWFMFPARITDPVNVLTARQVHGDAYFTASIGAARFQHKLSALLGKKMRTHVHVQNTM